MMFKKNINNIFDNNDQVGRIYNRVSLTPYLISQKKYHQINIATLCIAELIEKTIRLFQVKKDVKNFFGFDNNVNRLINNYYTKENIFVSRFDAYLDENENIQFLEFNTDYPGSIIRLDGLHECIYNFLGLDKYHKNNNFISSFINIAKNIYKTNKKNGIYVIGHGSWESKEKIFTLNFLKKCLIKAGMSVEIGQWSNIISENKGLFLKNEKIGILFRAELSDRIINLDFDDYNKILSVAERGKIFIYNPTSTILAGSKSIMALWYTDFFQKYLTSDEKKNIKKYIPQTIILNDNNKMHISDNKDDYILKPIFGHGGKGIIIGKNTDFGNWKEIINDKLSCNKYIGQKYITPLEMSINILELNNNEVLENEKVKININPWYCHKKVIGISGRFAKSDIININKGGGALPVYYKK